MPMTIRRVITNDGVYYTDATPKLLAKMHKVYVLDKLNAGYPLRSIVFEWSVVPFKHHLAIAAEIHLPHKRKKR